MIDLANTCGRRQSPKLSIWMKSGLLVFLILLLVSVCQAQSPYESEQTLTPVGEIDRLVARELTKRGIEAAKPASDEVFFRRAYVDITGMIPLPQAYRKYQKITPDKRRGALIEALMETEAFDDYWALKWSDLLRIKAEFPINLWPNGVQAYYHWIVEAVTSNMPYDEFARHLLTSSGSNFRVPPVNFYRAIEGQEPETIAAAVSLTLMGVRFSSWSDEQQSDMANIFSRVAYKKTDEWKEEIVYLDPGQYSPLDITFPGGRQATIAAGKDPRDAFADWLIHPENPWFARNLVNRAWFWLMGRGLIQEPDDIREDNPSVNPALLAYLEKEFVESGYNIKHVFRLILNSRTYQQSSIPQSDNPEATPLFAHYIVRRLDAEVLFDALRVLGGTGEIYQSPVPEPFTFVPEYNRTVELSDGSITSQFLEKFGRPGRDTGLELERDNDFSVDQSMYLLNSSQVQKRIESSPRLRDISRRANRNPERRIEALYRLILSRTPTDQELAFASSYPGMQAGKRQALDDLCWALLNTKEFLFRH
jgi:hypothetical protein